MYVKKFHKIYKGKFDFGVHFAKYRQKSFPYKNKVAVILINTAYSSE
jgi:hypothetical protein